MRIGDDAESALAYPVSGFQPMPKAFAVLTLEGCDTVEAAEALRGKKIWVSLEELPPLEAGEFYHFQLIGLRVLGPDGTIVGTVAAVEENSSADNLVVQAKSCRYMIPLIADAVAAIDIEAGFIQLTAMEGLLEDGY